MRSDAAILDVLLTAASAIAEVVAATPAIDRARRGSGHADQYAIDVIADQTAVQLLLASGVGVHSEESGQHETDRNIVVVLDPVDGSQNFARCIPWFGPSLCAVDESGPVAAVVLNLATGTTYTAIRAGGAMRNGVRITASTALRLDEHATVHADRDFIDLLTCRRLNFGASAHSMCLVADGSVDAYADVATTQQPWDYLGAALIVSEAGGVVVPRHGVGEYRVGDESPRQLIAAGTREVASILLESFHRA